MSSRWSLTRGSMSGVMFRIRAMSSAYAAAKRDARAVGSSPASAARLMILSSMSVTLRTNVTFVPVARRCLTMTS